MNNIEPLLFKIEILQQNALNGDGLSAYILGRSYFSSENGALCDYSKAFEWYKYGGDKLQDVRCIYGMAICYDDGVGILEKDSQRADNLFKKAYEPLKEMAQQGDPFSMFILGAYYFYGFADVEQDNKKAFETIYSSAQLGHLAGIYDIGTFYHNGIGVDIDFEKSKKYLTLAASAGLERAKQKLKDWENDYKIKGKVGKK